MSSGSNTIGGELLRKFVERIENINEKIEDLKDDRRVVMAEAKVADLVPEGINYIIRKRKLLPLAADVSDDVIASEPADNIVAMRGGVRP